MDKTINNKVPKYAEKLFNSNGTIQIPDIMQKFEEESSYKDIFLLICREIKIGYYGYRYNDFLVEIKKRIPNSKELEIKLKDLYNLGIINFLCDDIEKVCTNEELSEDEFEKLLIDIKENNYELSITYSNPGGHNSRVNFNGKQLWATYLGIQEEEKKLKELEETISKITEKYIEQYENQVKELDEKQKELDIRIENGTVRNIEILSIFSGIIAILLANIMGVSGEINLITTSENINKIFIINLVLINAIMLLPIIVMILLTYFLFRRKKSKK